MTKLTPNHPAVEAAHGAARAWMADLQDELPGDLMVYVLTSALPHLTADDLRATDAAEEIRTEGWMQGWAAGRDLDGDEDATPYLRNTPAGKQLLAEGWEAACGKVIHMAWADSSDAEYLADEGNPYRESAP